jgi:CBS domain-containing protein
MENRYFEPVDSYEDEPRKDRRALKAVELDRPIRILPLREPVCVDASSTAQEAIRLMQEHRMGSVLVTREGRLEGIFTERDVLHRIASGEADPSKVPVADVMRPDPQVLSPEDPMSYALNLMSVGGFRHVPLTDESGRAVAVVSVKDIVNYMMELFPDKVLNVPPTPPIPADSREGA